MKKLQTVCHSARPEAVLGWASLRPSLYGQVARELSRRACGVREARAISAVGATLLPHCREWPERPESPQGPGESV